MRLYSGYETLFKLLQNTIIAYMRLQFNDYSTPDGALFRID